MNNRQQAELDRAFSVIFASTPNPKSKYEQIENLQNQIEDMGFILADKQDLINVLQDINKNLVARNQDLQSTKNTLQHDRDAAVARSTSLESDVRNLREQSDLAKRLQERLTELQSEHDEYVKESHKVISRYATAAQTEKGNAEHLARQAIRLQQENQKLTAEVTESRCAIKENQTLRNLVKVTYNEGLDRIIGLIVPFFGLRKAQKIARKIMEDARQIMDNNNIKI